MPRSAQTNIDPRFWDRLRETLKEHMRVAGLTQRELSAVLGIDPTTFNNFLNRQTKALGGLAVALACTVVDLTCAGAKIGKIQENGRSDPASESFEDQLILEFDSLFEVMCDVDRPTLVLRKPSGRHDRLRLEIRRMA